MTDTTKEPEDFDDELAEEERAHDEAYGAARDAWFNDKVLEEYKRAQNARLVNAFATRVLKSYVPHPGKADE